MTDRQEPGSAPEGLLLVDKPGGWTSHDVVARARRLLGTRKVGHAGTLDPMATGLLVLGVGRATKLLTYLAGADKTYSATVRLGVATSTDDAEGEVVSVADTASVTETLVRQGISRLVGNIQQVPSSVSAIKVDGRRAYARVRAGEQVELAARPVRIDRFEVLAVRRPVTAEGELLDLDVGVDCSSGTYIRALARDLGAGLGVGGHLTALRRHRVGPFTLDQARTLPPREPASSGAGTAGGRAGGDASGEGAGAPSAPVLTPLAEAARAVLPARQVSEAEAQALRHGRRIGKGGHAALEVPVAAFAPDGALVAIVLTDASPGDAGADVGADAPARPTLVFA